MKKKNEINLTTPDPTSLPKEKCNIWNQIGSSCQPNYNRNQIKGG